MDACPKCFAPVGAYDQTCAKCGAKLGGASLLASARTSPLAMDRPDQPVRVSITDLDMPIGSMVVLLLKLAVASIPAAIVVTMVSFAAMAFLAMIFGGLGMVTR